MKNNMNYESEFKVTALDVKREVNRIRIEMREYDEEGKVKGKVIRRPVDNSVTDTREGV